jgi:hypothetical protein
MQGVCRATTLHELGSICNLGHTFHIGMCFLIGHNELGARLATTIWRMSSLPFNGHTGITLVYFVVVSHSWVRNAQQKTDDLEITDYNITLHNKQEEENLANVTHNDEGQPHHPLGRAKLV